VDKEEDCQAAIFLACIGTDAYDVYANMEFAEESDMSDPAKLIETFERHCVGEIDEVYERYVFNRRQQEPGESFDTFVGDLRRLVANMAWSKNQPYVIVSFSASVMMQRERSYCSHVSSI